MPWSDTQARLSRLAANLRAHLAYYRALYDDPRTPFFARVCLWLAIAYTLLPFDIIPDFIPVIGHLDDLIIVPALLLLALRFVPREVQEEHRRRFFP